MTRSGRKSNAGFSMFEVLITLIITSIGLLGLSAMQLISMKNVNSSNYRTLATMYAYDMAERIRSNRSVAPSYDGINGGPTTKPSCSPCSATQMVNLDAFEWNDVIKGGTANDLSQGGLPNGNGTVSRVGTTDYYDITVSWDEQEQDDTGGSVTGKSFTLRIRLNS